VQGIDVVKSRMQGLNAAQYSSSLDCAMQIMKQEGIGGFYKGVGPRLTRVTLEVAITMSMYSEIVAFLDSVSQPASQPAVHAHSSHS
jgi:solute carrier family 25 citrate transporter 1